MKVTYTYVYESCTVPGNFVHNALYVWPGVGAGYNAANAVEYGTEIYGILFYGLENDTILHLRIWRISRLSRTVPVLYVTQK
jgi:hypothetical protein